jgi:outer membrane protein OmpA-like peptidoglycan-associated protein
MDSENEHNYYWPAYVDFMTVLFFIALAIGGYTYYQYKEVVKGKKQYQGLVTEVIHINDTLKAEFRKRNIQVDTVAKNKIKLQGDFFFDTDSSRLRDTTASDRLVIIGQSIKKVLDQGNNRRRFTVLIEGHTDSRGDTAHNDVLSYKRALSIANLWRDRCELILPTYEIIPAGFGLYEPVRPNTSEFNMELNRRIEISIIPKMSEFTKLIQH